MGWSNSELMRDVILAVKPRVASVSNRIEIYVDIIRAFHSCDWDVDSECLGIDYAWDQALRSIRPGMEWELYESQGMLAKDDQECP